MNHLLSTIYIPVLNDCGNSLKRAEEKKSHQLAPLLASFSEFGDVLFPQCPNAIQGNTALKKKWCVATIVSPFTGAIITKETAGNWMAYYCLILKMMEIYGRTWCLPSPVTCRNIMGIWATTCGNTVYSPESHFSYQEQGHIKRGATVSCNRIQVMCSYIVSIWSTYKHPEKKYNKGEHIDGWCLSQKVLITSNLFSSCSKDSYKGVVNKVGSLPIATNKGGGK